MTHLDHRIECDRRAGQGAAVGLRHCRCGQADHHPGDRGIARRVGGQSLLYREIGKAAFRLAAARCRQSHDADSVGVFIVNGVDLIPIDQAVETKRSGGHQAATVLIDGDCDGPLSRIAVFIGQGNAETELDILPCVEATDRENAEVKRSRHRLHDHRGEIGRGGDGVTVTFLQSAERDRAISIARHRRPEANNTGRAHGKRQDIEGCGCLTRQIVGHGDRGDLFDCFTRAQTVDRIAVRGGGLRYGSVDRIHAQRNHLRLAALYLRNKLLE